MFRLVFCLKAAAGEGGGGGSAEGGKQLILLYVLGSCLKWTLYFMAVRGTCCVKLRYFVYFVAILNIFHHECHGVCANMIILVSFSY